MSKPEKEIAYLNVDRNSLEKITLDDNTEKELEIKMENILKNKIHGISFSPYLEGQNPDEKAIISQQQIADRLEVIRPYTKWVRTFSCSNGNEEVPRIAHEKSLKTLVGVWISEDKEENEIEIQNAIRIARQGYVDLLAIGNEVLLRKEVDVDELIGYIRRVKSEVPNIQIGYVDAYYMYINYPEIVDEVDVLFVNCYPFWEHCDIDISINYMKEMYKLAKSASKSKKVIITETGWPTKGEQYGGAKPGYINAMKYFILTHMWAQNEGIETFYFSSFDEVWKMNHEGEYGAYWGIWDKDGKYKFKK
ncbi:glycosyl hydrolase family 17 protein [Candidatus Izemoplasma sp. B36]|uniref:glycoside hydrolase family 17 protein n=1 Tax=Candidatus Izemoplasma sp. B36 TaxID=3242468 RepID=UPI0035573E0C